MEYPLYCSPENKGRSAEIQSGKCANTIVFVAAGPPVRCDSAQALWPVGPGCAWLVPSPQRGFFRNKISNVFRHVASGSKWSHRIPLENSLSLGLQEYHMVWEHLLVWLTLRYQHSTFTDADQICIYPFSNPAWESA